MKKRTYQQNCALALAGDLLSERWTLLIFRELLLQPCRFKQLNLWLKGMGTNLLTARLKELEALNFIEKQDNDDKRSAYQLTQQGQQIEPLVLAIIRWGITATKPIKGYSHFHHWDLLAMKALFIGRQNGKRISIQFEHDNLLAWVEVTVNAFNFKLNVSQKADITLPYTIADLRQKQQQGEYDNHPEMQQFLAYFNTSV